MIAKQRYEIRDIDQTAEIDRLRAENARLESYAQSASKEIEYLRAQITQCINLSEYRKLQDENAKLRDKLKLLNSDRSWERISDERDRLRAALKEIIEFSRGFGLCLKAGEIAHRALKER